jgi:hypothetical protein
VRPCRRRFVAVYLLGNYVFLLAGIPLPLPAEKDVSRPFPCQHHQCGCANADQCWRGCCCYSHAEKLAWAEAHGVYLPAELVAESRDHSGEKASCCLAEAGSKPTHADPHTRDEQACCSHDHQSSPAPETEKQTDGVIGIRALTCQGGSAVWLMIATVTPPAPEFVVEPDLTSRQWIPLGAPSFRGQRWAPDPPPPRV